MSRWRIAWLVALATAVSILLFRSHQTGLLYDTDTSVLLRTIKAKNAPLSWFWSDWPLGNHFYRPIPTLTFELDQRLYGSLAAGYAWSNAILAALCTLGLFWLLREIFDSPFSACGGTLLFFAWQTSLPGFLILAVDGAAYGVLLVGILRHRKNWKLWLPAFLSIEFFERILIPLQPLHDRVIEWLPGRTASTMTLFALAAMASYARYTRLEPLFDEEKEAVATSTDRPATKSSRHRQRERIPRSVWAGVSLLATVGAFACYEQAVMLPACLLGIGIYFRMKGRPLDWRLQAGFWAILLAYLEVRHQVIPPGKSPYQAQQLRASWQGPVSDLSTMLFPPLGTLSSLSAQRDEGIYLFLDPNVYSTFYFWALFSCGAYQLRRNWKEALTGWLLPVIAFLPMAFVKIFEHYYYWPMALRTILVVASAPVAYALALTAVSPPKLQAPLRLRPAPGSLPNP